MNAKMRILFSEVRYETLDNAIPDFLQVELRQWKCGDVQDVIMNIFLTVNGQHTAESIALSCRDYVTNADLIRVAINRFDEMLAAHPNRDRMIEKLY